MPEKFQCCFLKHHSKQSAILKCTEAAAGYNYLHLSPLWLLRTLKSSQCWSRGSCNSTLQKQKEHLSEQRLQTGLYKTIPSADTLLYWNSTRDAKPQGWLALLLIPNPLPDSRELCFKGWSTYDFKPKKKKKESLYQEFLRALQQMPLQGFWSTCNTLSRKDAWSFLLAPSSLH